MNQNDEIPAVIIFGPTATGKTAIADALFSAHYSDSTTSFKGSHQCTAFRGKAEIISADSMQVYRGMDIGTAKPDSGLLDRLPHHLIDICEPSGQFCAGDFVRLSDIACSDIFSRGKLPVVLGGTAFYIRNFLYGLPVTPGSDPALRQLLRDRLENEGLNALYRELCSVDPESGARLHINDAYRILRALEVYHASGLPLSSFEISYRYRPGYRFLVLALDRKRDELYSRIDSRVCAMFDKGLASEVESLVEAGYTREDPGMQAIGYREFFMDFPQETRLDSIRTQIQTDSRKYAKRQETFIRSLPQVIHIHSEDLSSVFHALSGFYSPSQG